jgi:hypothetical protein
MLEILERLANVMLRATNDDEVTQNEYRLILDMHRCPISGKTMTNPVNCPDGTDYEKENIIQWLKSNTTSPVSGKPLKESELLPNRSSKDAIEEAIHNYNRNNADWRATDNPTLQEILQKRYIKTIIWSCSFTPDINEEIKNQIKKRIKDMDINVWPAINDKIFVCEIIWNMLPALRSQVYQEFRFVAGAMSINAFITLNASNFFKTAMASQFTNSRYVQLETALDLFCAKIHKHNTPIMKQERWDRLQDFFQLRPETRPIIQYDRSNNTAYSSPGIQYSNNYDQNIISVPHGQWYHS